MTFSEFNFFSEALGMMSRVNVLLPDIHHADKPFKVLYLLHGMSDDQSAWMRNTCLERIVGEKAPNLCVVMPFADISFYCDEVYGNKFYTYISKELPKIIETYFNVSTKREDTFVAGLSMGGYGATKIALANPDKFKAFATFSGALRDYFNTKYENDFEKILKIAFGTKEEYYGSVNDIHFTAKEALKSGNAPEAYVWCGDLDFLIEENRDFDEFLSSINYEHKYFEVPGFGHEWRFWEKCVGEFIDIAIKDEE